MGDTISSWASTNFRRWGFVSFRVALGTGKIPAEGGGGTWISGSGHHGRKRIKTMNPIPNIVFIKHFLFNNFTSLLL
jgi:hypothetical protein